MNIPLSSGNAVLENPKYEDAIFAGAFNGIILSVDRDQSWKVIVKCLSYSFDAVMTLMTGEKDSGNAFCIAPINNYNYYLLMFNDL